ncbi:proline dehydrogenase family protein [Gorillibacterium sp. sgz500922]|uniref:proline dehydrogenase family protein n=1 Tax=Gorillibacterium sp. sgz500922 TaxID=3446694 RepID=UPI003F66CC2F
MGNRSEWYRKAVLSVSANRLVERGITKFGMRLAKRFIAAEDRIGALEAVRSLNADGIAASLDFLGEGVATPGEAEASRDEYLRLLDDIANAGVRAHVSLKPSQMGLRLDPEACYRNIRLVVASAAEKNIFVRIDMEDSSATDATLSLAMRLREEGYTRCGTVLQAYLHRSVQDARELLHRNIPLRLVKGAYREPAAIAWQSRTEVVTRLKSLIRLHLDHGVYTAIASHDDEIINWTVQYARQNGIASDRFEIQMLYGLRMKEQRRLVKEGYRVRCYVPYGTHWYPYYTRRLAERPANLGLVLRNLFR